MRHQYVPLFEDILDSRVWEEPAPTLKVWIWFLVSADPEGFRGGTVRSVARGANVDEEEARAALGFLCAPDPESRDDEHEGRMLEPVARGWRVVNLAKWRELAKREAERARKRRWAEKSRRDVDAESTDGGRDVDPPKPKPTPKPKPVASQHSEPSGVQGVEYRELPKGWQPSEALRAEALLAGIPGDYLDERIATLRGRRIGGNTPITDLDEYIRGLFPQWRRWYEARQLKESTERATGIPCGRPKGLPAWVHIEHVAIATARSLDIAQAAKAFAKKHALHRSEPPPAELFRMFREYLNAA